MNGSASAARKRTFSVLDIATFYNEKERPKEGPLL
jgi:hypothetical protein